jgi:hypothetical protein
MSRVFFLGGEGCSAGLKKLYVGLFWWQAGIGGRLCFEARFRQCLVSRRAQGNFFFDYM